MVGGRPVLWEGGGCEDEGRAGEEGCMRLLYRTGQAHKIANEVGDVIHYALLVISACTVSPSGAPHETIHNRYSFMWSLSSEPITAKTTMVVNVHNDRYWRLCQYFLPPCDVPSPSHYNFHVTYPSHHNRSPRSLDQYSVRFISLSSLCQQTLSDFTGPRPQSS